MRDYITLVESYDPIEALITSAEFTEQEEDSATSGYCGTFAIALQRVLAAHGIQSQLAVFVLKNKDGSLRYDKDGVPFWRHVAVKSGDFYYDIQGKQLDEWIGENYCWGNPHGWGVEMTTEAKLVPILNATNDSHSLSYLGAWQKRLGDATSAE